MYKTLNSYTLIHSYEFMIWIHYWKKRIQYSEFVILNSVVKYVMCIYEFKNQNSDFCNEFIYEFNFYEFMYLKS